MSADTTDLDEFAGYPNMARLASMAGPDRPRYFGPQTESVQRVIEMVEERMRAAKTMEDADAVAAWILSALDGARA